MKATENLIVAGLQRHMRMFGNPRRGCDHRDQLVSPVHGLDRADANLLDTGLIEQHAQKVDEALLGLKVASPAAEINPAQNNSAITGANHSVGFSDHPLQSRRAAPSPPPREKAERTALDAS